MSPNYIAFLSTAATWIDHQWKLREILVDFTELKGPHSGKNLAVALYCVMKSLGIDKKVSCMNIYCGGQLLIQTYKFITIIADNASNNRMMMASLATRLCRTDPVGDYDSDCCKHTKGDMHTYCLCDRQRRGGGQDSLSARKSLLLLLLKVLLVLSFIFVDP